MDGWNRVINILKPFYYVDIYFTTKRFISKTIP